MEATNIFTQASFKEIPSNLDPETVFKYDVDQTLIDSKTYLGTGYFYSNLKKTARLLQNDGYVFKTDNLRSKIHVFVLKKVEYMTEIGLPSYISSLQDNNYSVLGLTARPKRVFNTDLTEITQKQLLSVGIDLQKSYNPFLREDALESHKSHGGVYFTDDTDKGTFLVKLYEYVKPKFLVFGDDLENNVMGVAGSMREINVPCHTFVYRPYRDNPVNDGNRPFNLFAAAIQLDKLVHKNELIEDFAAEKTGMSESTNESEYFQKIIKRIDIECSSYQINLDV